MVQSKAETVDEYLSQVSPKRQSYLRQVRDLAARVLVDHEERMQWGMPVYVRNGRVRFGFAEQKQFVSLYFMEPRVLDENRPRDRRVSCRNLRPRAARMNDVRTAYP